MLTFLTGRWLALGFGLLPLALGEALMTPVMVAAVRRYTNTQQRSISFAIFFALMSAGFLIAAFVFDYVRKGLGEHGHFAFAGLDLSTYRVLFLVSFFLTLPNLVLMYFGLREGVEVTDEGVRISRAQKAQASIGMGGALVRVTRSAFCDTGRIFAGLWRQSTFYKFLILLSLVVGLRLIYYHMYYTYPKFGIRELGEGAPVGRLWSINGLTLLVLVPIVGALTQKIPAFRMIIVGSVVSASSVFIMALPTGWFQPLANGFLGDVIAHRWLGVAGEVNPYYIMIFLFVVFLSIGEALWNPRLYEYTAAIAPKGQEASYMSLSFLPYFLAKFFVGMFSGNLLSHYCPQTGDRHSETLWLIIACMTLTTPVGLLLFGRFIRVHEAGRKDEA